MNAPETSLRSFPKGLFASRLKALASAAKDPDRQRLRNSLSRLRQAGAVLVAFDPVSLNPVPGSEPFDEQARLAFFAELSTNDDAPRELGWGLATGMRRRALQEMKSSNPSETRQRLVAALGANPKRPTSEAQTLFEQAIAGTVPPLASLNRDQLSALAAIAEWLAGIVDGLQSVEDVSRAAARAELLHPLRQLAGAGFVGRESELQRLADHVGVLPIDLASDIVAGLLRYGRRFTSQVESGFGRTRKALFLYGPGGVGKSTLLARFVLDHAEDRGSGAPLPFVLLDVDKPSVEPLRPLTFLVEALGQLQHQLEGLQGPARELSSKLLDNLAVRETSALESIVDESSDLIEEFARLINHQLKERPLVFVVDTFEEVQFLGSEVVYLVQDFLRRLQDAVPQLRIILSGRVPPADTNYFRLPVGELPPEPARDLIATSLKQLGSKSPGPEVLQELVDQLGGNPMVLRLAARLIAENDFEGIREAGRRREWLRRIRVEAVQARLYGRILGHLHGSELEKLALPGLIVRRITPDLIFEVLAEPCKLSLATRDAAKDLFNKMAAELALVTRDPKDQSLKYEPYIRRIMLDTLDDVVPPETARKIDQRAVSFWQSRSGPIARAEELYHRLRLGAPRTELEERWDSSAASLLRGALPEIPPSSRAWLANKLGVTVGTEARADAVQGEWEQHAERAARRFLETGQAEKALTVLRERPERLPGSPLYALEARALYAVDRLQDAIATAESGLAAKDHGDAPAEVSLLLLIALTLERQSDFEAAHVQAWRAVDVAYNAGVSLEHLMALLRVLRISRRIGDRLEEYATCQEQAGMLVRVVGLERVQKDATLLCEAAAELGSKQPELLRIAMNAIGTDILRNSARGLIEALLVAAAELKPDDLSKFRGGDSRELAKLALNAAGRELDRNDTSDAVRRLVVQVFQEASDRTVQRASSAGDSQSAPSERRIPEQLSDSQLSQLIKVTSDLFSTDELSQILLIYMHRELAVYAAPSMPSRDVAYHLLSSAQKEGWLRDLVHAIESARPGSEKLRLVLDRVFPKSLW
jgi:cellulose synthase operon protein C